MAATDAHTVRYTFGRGWGHDYGTTGWQLLAIYDEKKDVSPKDVHVLLELPGLTEEKVKAIAMILNAPDNY